MAANASIDPAAASAVLPIGTEVSAKYRGAFCEARIKHVEKRVTCKVVPKDAVGVAFSAPDDDVKGPLKIGGVVEAKHPHTGHYIECTLLKISDASSYTVVFDDGDVVTLRRTQLCLKGDKHFLESETLDQLPLTHPEHFGTPVMQSAKKEKRRRSGFGVSTSSQGSDDDDENSDDDVSSSSGGGAGGRLATAARQSAAADKNVGRIVLISQLIGEKKKWFPALVVLPGCAEGDSKGKDVLHLKSFKDSKVLQLPRKETKEYTKDSSNKCDVDKTTKLAFERAAQYSVSKELPPSWNKKDLLGIADSDESDESENEAEEEDDDDPEPATATSAAGRRRQVVADSKSQSSDDEPNEEKDRFVAQLYKYMDDSGTPINKAPRVYGRELNLYKLFNTVRHRGGYNKASSAAKWKDVSSDMGLPASTANQIKRTYKQYLQSFEDFYRKMGDMAHFESGGRHGRAAMRSGPGSAAGAGGSSLSPSGGSTGRSVLTPRETRELSAAAAAAAAAASPALSSVGSSGAPGPNRTSDGGVKQPPGAAASRCTSPGSTVKMAAAAATTVESIRSPSRAVAAGETAAAKKDALLTIGTTPKRPSDGGVGGATVASVRLGRDPTTEARVQPYVDVVVKSSDQPRQSTASSKENSGGSGERELVAIGGGGVVVGLRRSTPSAQQAKPLTASPSPSSGNIAIAADQTAATSEGSGAAAATGSRRAALARGSRKDDSSAATPVAAPVQLKKEPAERREGSPRIRAESPRGAQTVGRPGSRGTAGRLSEGSRTGHAETSGVGTESAKGNRPVKVEPTEKRDDTAAEDVLPKDDSPVPKKRCRRSSSKIDAASAASSADNTPKLSTSTSIGGATPRINGSSCEDSSRTPVSSGDRSETMSISGVNDGSLAGSASGLTVMAEVDYPPGTKLRVRYGQGRGKATNVYEAKVNEVVVEESGQLAYFVHYAGWNIRYDEWVKADRIMGPYGKVEKKKMWITRVQSASSLKKKGPRPVDARSSSAAAEANCSSPGSGGGASPGVRAPTPGAVARATSTELGSETANSPAVSVAPRSPPPSGLERCTSSSTDDSSPLPAQSQHPVDSGAALSSPAHVTAAAAPACATSSSSSNVGPCVEEPETASGNGSCGDSATYDTAAGAPAAAAACAASSGSCSAQRSAVSGVPAPATDVTSWGEAELREEASVLSSPGCTTSQTSGAQPSKRNLSGRSPRSTGREPKGGGSSLSSRRSDCQDDRVSSDRRLSASPPPSLRSPDSSAPVDSSAEGERAVNNEGKLEETRADTAINDEPGKPDSGQTSSPGAIAVVPCIKAEPGDLVADSGSTSSRGGSPAAVSHCGSVASDAAECSPAPTGTVSCAVSTECSETELNAAAGDLAASEEVAGRLVSATVLDAVVQQHGCDGDDDGSPAAAGSGDSASAGGGRSAAETTVGTCEVASPPSPTELALTEPVGMALSDGQRLLSPSAADKGVLPIRSNPAGDDGSTAEPMLVPADNDDEDSDSDSAEKRRHPPQQPSAGRRRRRRLGAAFGVASAGDPASTSVGGGGGCNAAASVAKQEQPRQTTAGAATRRTLAPQRGTTVSTASVGGSSSVTMEVGESPSQESATGNDGSSEDDDKERRGVPPAVVSSSAMPQSGRKRKVDQLAAAAESALQAAEEDEMSNPAAGSVGKRSAGLLSNVVAPPAAKRRRQPIRRKQLGGGSDETAGTATAAMAYDSSHLSPSSQSLSPRTEMTEGWPASIASRVASSSSTAAAPTVSAPDGDAGSLSAEAAAKRSGGDALLWLSEAAVVGCPVAGRHSAAGGSESSVSGGIERGGYTSGILGRRTSPPWQDEAAGARVASIDRAAGDGGSSVAERTAAAATAGTSAGKPRRSTAGAASAASTAAGFTSPTYDGGHGNGTRTSAAIAARRSMKQQQLSAPTRGFRKGTKAGVRHATMAAAAISDQDESSNQDAALLLSAAAGGGNRPSPLKKPSYEATTSSCKSPRQPKYNFDIRDDLAKITDRDKRITFIYSKMCEVRRLYSEQRNELQELDRRRKKRTTKMAAVAASAAAGGSVTSAAVAATPGRAALICATPSTKIDQGTSALLSLSSPTSSSSSSSQQNATSAIVTASVGSSANVPPRVTTS